VNQAVPQEISNPRCCMASAMTSSNGWPARANRCGLPAVRHPVVRVFHAATGRAPGQSRVFLAGAGGTPALRLRVEAIPHRARPIPGDIRAAAQSGVRQLCRRCASYVSRWGLAQITAKSEAYSPKYSPAALGTKVRQETKRNTKQIVDWCGDLCHTCPHERRMVQHAALCTHRMSGPMEDA
jgi:hypothetical protein